MSNIFDVGNNMAGGFKNATGLMEEAGKHFSNGSIFEGIGAGLYGLWGYATNIASLGVCNALGEDISNKIDYDASANGSITWKKDADVNVVEKLIGNIAEDKAGSYIVTNKAAEEGNWLLANGLGLLDVGSDALALIPVGKVIGTAAKTAGKIAVGEAAGVATKVAAQTAGKEVASIAGKEVASAAGKEAVSIAGKEVASAAGKEVASVAGKEAASIAGKEVASAAGKEVGKKTVSSIGKTLVKGVTGTVKEGLKIGGATVGIAEAKRLISPRNINLSIKDGQKDGVGGILAGNAARIMSDATSFATTAVKDVAKATGTTLMTLTGVKAFLRDHPALGKFVNSCKAAGTATLNSLGKFAPVAYATATVKKVFDIDHKYNGVNIEQMVADIKRRSEESGKTWIEVYTNKVKELDEELGIDSSTRWLVGGNKSKTETSDKSTDNKSTDSKSAISVDEPEESMGSTDFAFA